MRQDYFGTKTAQRLIVEFAHLLCPAIVANYNSYSTIPAKAGINYYSFRHSRLFIVIPAPAYAGAGMTREAGILLRVLPSRFLDNRYAIILDSRPAGENDGSG